MFDEHHCCHQLFHDLFSLLWTPGCLPIMAQEDSGAKLPAGSAGYARPLLRQDDALPLPLRLPHPTLNRMKS